MEGFGGPGFSPATKPLGWTGFSRRSDLFDRRPTPSRDALFATRLARFRFESRESPAKISKQFGGRLAQLGERIVRNDEAGGSNPLPSTKISLIPTHLDELIDWLRAIGRRSRPV